MTSPAANYVYAFNGWLFGGPGQGVQVLKVDGLEDLPEIRTQDDNRGYQDGMFSGRDFLGGRRITFTLQIMNDSAGTMQTYLAQLKSNLAPQQSGTGVLQIQLPGRVLQRVNGRVRRRSITVDPDYAYGKSLAIVEVFCPDPRIYDDAITAGVLTPGSSVGRNYPRVYPETYTVSIGGAVAVASFTNTGNTTIFPTFTFTGVMTNPQVQNSTTGQSVKVNVTLAATDVLVVVPDLRAVTLNGNPARNLIDPASQWFGFPPGATSIGIIADTTTSGTCTVAYRNGSV